MWDLSLRSFVLPSTPGCSVYPPRPAGLIFQKASFSFRYSWTAWWLRSPKFVGSRACPPPFYRAILNLARVKPFRVLRGDRLRDRLFAFFFLERYLSAYFCV